MNGWRRSVALLVVSAAIGACAGGSQADPPLPAPGSSTTALTATSGAVAEVSSSVDQPAATTSSSSTNTSSATSAPPPDVTGTHVEVVVDVDDSAGPISSQVRGLSGDADTAYLIDVGATVNSWGGNPASRFNYEIGHAWNSGADWEFRNTNYGHSGDESIRFAAETTAAGASVRLTVPTLGWVAKNDDDTTCSFPLTSGGCASREDVSCDNPTLPADPTIANVPSDSAGVRAWVARLVAEGADIGYIAMDNEPELWGHTHYDIHPTCTTYEEVLEKYLTYATALRDVAPSAKLMGPVMCCWFSYWGSAPGTAEGDDAEFLAWFLEKVREHDTTSGRRSLDVLDVHYYPQSDVYNDDVDPDTSARRLRSTSSLWDPSYSDESWINEPVRFIPRLKETIAVSYPGTPIGISEWNFGAEEHMNGALAIADVLGIFGREGVHMASYWRSPDAASPGYFAFKVHGNYDDRGSSFDGDAVRATSSDIERLSSYAALDPETGRLKVMLINKDPDREVTVDLDLEDWRSASEADLYRYSEAEPTRIVPESLSVGASGIAVPLPPYSITLLDLEPARG